MARSIPEGRFTLAFRPEGDDIPSRFRDPTYRFPRLDDVRRAFVEHRLDVQHEIRAEREPGVLLVTATRKL